MSETLTVEFKLATGRETLGSLYASLATSQPQDATGDREVEISTGQGLGHLGCYVAVDGKQVIATSLGPLVNALVEAALAIVDGE